MLTPNRSFATSLLIVCACSGVNESGLYITTDRSTFDGRTEHAVLKVQAFGANGDPGRGVVSLSTPAGHFVDGPQAQLTEGFSTVTFECNPADDSACSGSLRISATWAGESSGVTIKVTPSTVVTPVNWLVVPTNTLAPLVAMAASSDKTTLWAVGDTGTVAKLVNSTWSVVPTLMLENLTALSVTPNDEPLVVGEHGTLLVWSEKAFHAVDTGLSQVTFSAIVAAATNDAEIATDSGQIYHFDGTTLTKVFDLGGPISSMVRNNGVIWAGGDGAFAVLDPLAGWTSQSAPVLARYSVAFSSPEGLWLAGSRMDQAGGVVLLGTPDWHTVTLADPITSLAVVPKGDERFALTASSVYRQIGTGGWVKVQTPSGGRAAFSRFAGDLVVVGPPGISLLRAP